MEAYSKGVLLSQAAEVGTHTEDGQLRPQVSCVYCLLYDGLHEISNFRKISYDITPPPEKSHNNTTPVCYHTVFI